MAKKSRIKRDYKRANDPQLLNKATKVNAAMTGNTYYPSPLPTLVVFKAGIQKFEDALNAAQHGDRVKIILKNDARAELLALMDQLADYVTLVANGDRAIMSTSGFTLSSEQKKTRIDLGVVENVKAVQGKNSGEADLEVDGVDGGKFYTFMFIEGIAAKGAPGWLPKGNTKPHVTLTDLKPATLYSIYVIVNGANDQETESEIVTRMFL